MQQKLINTFLPKTVQSIHLLPNALAVKCFHQLAFARTREARVVLSALQDKWFDNWKPSAVAKSNKRLKFKDEPTIGLYLPTLENKVIYSPIISSLDNVSVQLGLLGIDQMFAKTEPAAMADLKVILRAFVNEANIRDNESIKQVLEKTDLNTFIAGISRIK